MGVIEAGTKQTGNGSFFTDCDYYSNAYANYLGQYQDATFFSNDADTVKQFCLDNYVNRTLPWENHRCINKLRSSRIRLPTKSCKPPAC
jgi:hypothetical protein